MFSDKKFKQSLILLLCVLSYIVAVSWDFHEEKIFASDSIKIKSQNLDGAIKISWQIPDILKYPNSIYLMIIGEGKTWIKHFTNDETEYIFSMGEHGKLYHFQIAVNDDEEVLGAAFDQALFLDYSKIPDLPLLIIETEDGEDPPFEIVTHIDGDGQTIINNKELPCKIVMTRNNADSPNMFARVKVRGNTTATAVNQKPYKITFDKPEDILGLGIKYANREWVLLNTVGTSLNAYIATSLANLCEVQYQPKIMFVNVILNQKWKGLYLLSETIKRDKNRIDIDSSGYIFECDVYYWKPGTRFFRTPYVGKEYGYTFKYPNAKRLTLEDRLKIQNYLFDFEKSLFEGEGKHYSEYIDVDSFAKWILIQDILGNDDGMGSNLFFYKKDWNPDDVTSSKLFAGPMWDFDNDFIVPINEWSKSRVKLHYFEKLFEDEDFRESYKKNWNEVKDKILPVIKKDLNELNQRQGVEIQKSRELVKNRWDSEIPTVFEEIEQKLDWIEKRIQFIDTELKEGY